MKKFLEKFNKFRDSLADSIWGNVLIFFFMAAVIYGIIFIIRNYSDDSLSTSNLFTSISSSECSVHGFNLHGTLLTYIPEHAENDSFFDYDVVGSEDLVWAIKGINEDKTIKAILIDVDSAGGLPVAGEEVDDAIKNSEIPVIAVIRQTGASGAYWAISSANKIFASKNSDIGSIGVTMSYLNNVTKNQKDGYVYENLSAGKYKDAGSPDRSLTSEEKLILMRDVNIVHENFMQAVSMNRKIPIETVRGFADGSTVLGEKAKEFGLIDEIGGMYEAETYIEELIGEKPNICWQ